MTERRRSTRRPRPAMSLGVGERGNDGQVLQERTRPPMGEQQRHRIRTPPWDVHHVDGRTADLSGEMRQPRQHLLEASDAEQRNESINPNGQRGGPTMMLPYF